MPDPRRIDVPRRRFLRWSRIGAALVVLVVIAAVPTAVLRGGPPPAAVTIEPGVNLLDARTGAVVGQFPSILAGEISYSDGVFWALTLTPDFKSISFVGIDSRTRQVAADEPEGDSAKR